MVEEEKEVAGEEEVFVDEREGMEVVEGLGEERRGREEGGETVVVAVEMGGDGMGQL